MSLSESAFGLLSLSDPGIIAAVNGSAIGTKRFYLESRGTRIFHPSRTRRRLSPFRFMRSRWTLRIYKRQTCFGDPVTYEIAFKERYGPTVEQAIALANDILLVELQ